MTHTPPPDSTGDDDHDCLAGHAMRYEAHYGAPGTGEAWRCDTCGRAWSRVGGVFYPAESGAHILTPGQCE
jgi:hypothetical protein